LESDISDILADPIQSDVLSVSQSLSPVPFFSVYAPYSKNSTKTNIKGEVKQKQQQQELVSALGSALHETLAKYSVKDISLASQNDSYDKSPQTAYMGHFTAISEFWDGWFDDIEIDEEISSDLDNNNETRSPEDTSIAPLDQRRAIPATVNSSKNNNNNNKVSSSSSTTKRNVPRLKLNDKNANTANSTDVLLKISPIPTTCVLTPLIIDVTSKSKSEVTSLFLKSQGKTPSKVSSGSSSDECESHSLHKSRKPPKTRGTKSKKRKPNADQLAGLPGEKRPKHQMKNTKNLEGLQDVFKLNQVLKIKAVEDCEDEEIDIGDLTDTIPN